MSQHKKNKEFWRSKNDLIKVDMGRQIAALLTSNQILTSAAEASDFINWAVRDAWDRYQQYVMDQRKVIENEINALPLKISNATRGKEYLSENIQLPSDKVTVVSIEGLDEVGLNAVTTDDGIIRVQGIPTEAGDFIITILYKYIGWFDGQPLLERKIPFAVNHNPRDLWKDIPTSKDVPYFKEDKVCEYVKVEAGPDGTPLKDMVAASNRGRSHAQEGKPRDDHFQLFHSNDNGWYIIAVADGAGSAKFSRKGSEIACRSVVDYCKGKLTGDSDLEEKIQDYYGAENETSLRKTVGDVVYGIVGNAAYSAHKAIAEAAKQAEDANLKDFATTLLLSICKKFDFGWFVASFWVGDGAMCIYNKEAQTFKLLGTPDEGEFSGQTRFLTMPEIFADTASLYKRLRFEIVDDFTALMMMTDGVSDPMFGTDANLNDINKWNEFWDSLQTGFAEDEIPGVELTDNNEASKDQLLRWLDFWSPGEHDDRTIAILY